MNIFQIMGCTSDQYASLETYLVLKAKLCKQRGDTLIIGYNNIPESKEFIYDLQSQGARLYKLEAHSLFDFRFFSVFRRIIILNKIDLVHAYFAPTRHYAIIYAWLLGIKKRFRQGANLPLVHFKSRGIQFILFSMNHYLLSLFATKYICRSNAVLKEYRQMGISLNKLRVADGGTDTERYKKRMVNRKELSSLESNIIIGTASRLVKEKGIATLIDAIELLIKKDLKIICVILGDGPEKEALTKRVQEKQLEANVQFLGHRTNLEYYYNMLDIYVSTSVSEGMSNSILEAMACEKAVILSDIEPNKEIIETAKKSKLYVGELFKVGDKNDLVEKIEILLQHKNREFIGENARQLVLKNYDIFSRIAKEFDIYSE
jgi:glycosyltransferase involved in cell wall biosynthesis